MSVKAKWVVLFSLWAARLVPQPTPPLLVSNGWLAGSVSPCGTYTQYYGIPYATVIQRFQGPGPEPRWSGVLNAQNEHIRCSQRYNGRTMGQDDCLTLNVYTPLPKADNLYPVMIYIHGGGFRDGSGSSFIYGPEYLIKNDVILVTINYRLEILGFLCLGIKEAPGNAGLRDQAAAIKWVKKNICKFGGDPNNITLFGESAGAASVLYHMLSPISKGLFQRGIMQSGSGISPWAFQFEPLNIASKLAYQMGHDTRDPHEIYKLFMNKSSEELLLTRVPRSQGNIVLSETIFVPCVEKEIADIESFLPDTVHNLLTSGQYNKVPVIMGWNDAEGYLFAGKENDTTIANMNFYNALPRDLIFTNDKERNKTAAKLKDIYMGADNISKETLNKFAAYEGDLGITYPVVAMTELLIRTSEKPVFTYKMCYDGWLNLAKLFYGFYNSPGMTHADDLFYMFKFKLPILPVFLERNVVNKITKMWSNFARYGDPTPDVTSLLPVKWEPTEKTNPRVLVMNKEFSTAPLWDSETLLFWNETYTKYRREP